MITPVTMRLTRTQSAHDQLYGVCGAEFVPVEDSGSRQLSLMPADKEPFSVTVTVRHGGETAVAPVVRQPDRG